MNSLFLFVFVYILGVGYGYLNKIQLKYVKYILGSPESPEEIKQSTRELLVENYQPWLKNQYKSFIRQYGKTMNRVYVRELYQYAIYGLLESLRAYNGSVGLHKYADKFVFGQMYKGMNDLSILQPLKYSQIKQGHRTLKPILVSYNDYWMFDKLAQTQTAHQKSNIVKNIKEILESSPGSYRRLFYLRYDYSTLYIIRSIKDICTLESFSEETYRKKMNAILLYIKGKLE
jgi:hypothetical protein